MSALLLLATVAVGEPVIDAIYDEHQVACRGRETICLRVCTMSAFWTRYGAVHDPVDPGEVWSFATSVAFGIATDHESSQQELDAMAQLLLSARPRGPLLAAALLEGHSDPTVRASIARSLRWASLDEARTMFPLAVDDVDPDVRRTAVDALTWSPHASELRSLLAGPLIDPSPHVRARAERAYGWLTPE